MCGCGYNKPSAKGYLEVGVVYVEIELDGTLCPKRCPHYKTPEGFTDYNAIRNHFGELGYSVGKIHSVR